MKFLLPVLLWSMAVAVPAAAQHKGHDHSGQTPAAAAKSSAALPTTAEGEVRRVDRSAARITIKHGEIRNLDMPPMTMVFEVKDKALLDKVKDGDKVRFKAVNDAGRLVVTEMDAVR